MGERHCNIHLFSLFKIQHALEKHIEVAEDCDKSTW